MRKTSHYWKFSFKCRHICQIHAINRLNFGDKWRVAVKVVNGNAVGVVWKFEKKRIRYEEMRKIIPIGKIEAIEEEEVMREYL